MQGTVLKHMKIFMAEFLSKALRSGKLLHYLLQNLVTHFFHLFIRPSSPLSPFPLSSPPLPLILLPANLYPPPPLSLSLIMMSLINSPWTTIIVDGLNLLVIYSGVKRGILCLSLHLRSILTDSFINTLIFDMSIVLETKYTQQKYKMMLLAYKYISQMFCLFPQISV